MQAIEFKGKTQVVKTTPNQGVITVAFGVLTTEEKPDADIPAIAIQIKGKTGETVAEFALQPDSFGTLIEAIKELYDKEFSDDQPV
jgi:hypothetical protein